MLLLRFTVRHFVRHWRVNLVVLLSLLLATTLMAGLPLYSTAIAGKSLRLVLAEAPAGVRNLRVTGPASSLTAALLGDLQESLGSLFEERIEIRESGENQSLRGADFYVNPAGEQVPVYEEAWFRFWAFNTLESNVDIVEGEWPVYVSPPPNQLFQVQEVAIGQLAAEGAGLALGDLLYSEDRSLRLMIAAIVVPSDPKAEVWQGDLTLFEVERIERGNRPDKLTIPLLVPNDTMQQAVPGFQRYWRVLLDTTAINVDSAAQVRDDLRLLETRWRSVGIETGLVTLIDDFFVDLATAQVSVFLLTVQSMLFVLYTVAVIGSFWLDQSRRELATLVDRGFTGGQITRVFALQGLFLALVVAVPLGPPLARLLLGWWSGSSLPAGLPRLSWNLALLAALFAWLALVLPIALATRRRGSGHSVLAWQQQLTRPGQRTGWQRFYLDFFLLALGALVYWQLADSGSFARRLAGGNPAGVADPLLLLGPSLLLIAIALVFLRVFPYLLRLAAVLGRRRRDLILPFGLTRLARDPAGPSRVVLLISLAAALTFFAATFAHTLSVRQAQMAQYLSGADLVVSYPVRQPERLEALLALPGVQAGSGVYRNERTRYGDQLARQLTLLAVDPETLAEVTAYPPGLTRLSVADVLTALVPGPTGRVPAVFSTEAYPLDKEIGDVVPYVVGNRRVLFEVRGIIVNFPAVQQPYMLTNLALLQEAVDLEAQTAPFDGRREAWLVLAPAGYDEVVFQVQQQGLGRISGDAQATLGRMQANLAAAETVGAFNLNAIALAVLSVVVFLIVHYFSARQRLLEFGVLRSAGLSARQLLALLSLEGVILMALGLAAATAIGYRLAVLMRPFFSDALAEAVAGGALYAVLIDWPTMIALYAALVGFYVLALLLSSLALMRAGIHRVMRLGDE